MNKHWLDELKERLANEVVDPDVMLDRLVLSGIIDDKGQVTGHLIRWDADFAIAEIRLAADTKQIDRFRCLNPVFGMPGTELRVLDRDTMLGYLKAGKKIITAEWDARLSMWRQGPLVQLSANAWIVCDPKDDNGDNVGHLPTFS